MEHSNSKYNKIINSAWGINVVGLTGGIGDVDIEFGGTQNCLPAMRIGESVLTPGLLNPKGILANMRKIEDYLYESVSEEIDYELANKYFYSNIDVSLGACSSVRKGNFFGRNFDWFYDNEISLVLHTPKAEGRYASVGVASGLKRITEDIANMREDMPEIVILPFYLLDAVNEKGVVASINVVPVQKGITRGTAPLVEKREELCSRAIVRYIVDHFATATEAVEYIRDYVSIYAPNSLREMGYDLHVLVADEENTYIVEFVDNKMVILSCDTDGSNVYNRPYMTNFFLDGVTLNADGTVYTPETSDDTHNAMVTNGITSHGSGLERYNLIANNYANAGTKTGMTNLMNALKYTNTYNREEDPFWYTEAIGALDLTVTSPVEDFEPVINVMVDLYEHRSRDRGMETWQTAHSSVYDIENRKFYLHSQEGTNEYVFSIDTKGYGLPVVTTADNGKILKVVDGQWAVVNP